MSQSLQLVYWRCLIYFCVLFCDFQQSRQGGHRAKVWFQLIVVVVLLGQAEVCFWHGLFSLQQGKNCPHHYSRARVLIFTHNAVLLILMSIVLFISFHNLYRNICASRCLIIHSCCSYGASKLWQSTCWQPPTQGREGAQWELFWLLLIFN